MKIVKNLGETKKKTKSEQNKKAAKDKTEKQYKKKAIDGVCFSAFFTYHDNFKLRGFVESRKMLLGEKKISEQFKLNTKFTKFKIVSAYHQRTNRKCDDELRKYGKSEQMIPRRDKTLGVSI